MDTEPSGSLPAEVKTPKRTGKAILDLSEMRKATATADLGMEVEELSLGLGQDKQDSDDNKTGSETDTAGGNESQTNSHDEECFKEMDEHHKNKIDSAQTFLETLHNKKGPSPEAMLIACQDLSEQMEQAASEGEFKRSGSQGTVTT